MKNTKEHRKGLFGTLAFHIALLTILFFFGFSKEEPKEEKGIEINFFSSSRGGSSAPKATPKVKTVSSSTSPNSKPKVSQSSNAPKVVTQNVEETILMKQKNDEERKKKDEEEILLLEREREEQARKVEEQAKTEQAALIRAQTGSAFSSANKGSGTKSGSGAGSSNGDGVGKGLYNLNGRSLVGSLPQPSKEFQEEGTVVVEVEVDRFGSVTRATPILRGSTTQNSHLWKLAKEAALKAKFNSNANASAFQKGTITYQFSIN